MKRIALRNRGKFIGKYALVDNCDFEKVSVYKWYLHPAGYAITHYKAFSQGYIFKLMHRFILDAKDGMEVDHKNGNCLDNRRLNIRTCTHKQNLCNSKLRTQENKTSRYKGVRFHKNYWEARIHHNGKQIYLGTFKSENDAARCYNLGAVQIFGDFARINKINRNDRRYKTDGV